MRMIFKIGVKTSIWVVFITTLTCCTKNIEPLPDTVSFAPSISLPVGEGEFNLSKSLETLGVPVVNLTENVPDWAKHNYVYIQDTFAVNLNEVYNQSDLISYIMIRVNIWNEFPLQGNAQIWIFDSGQNKIDSLFTQPASVPAAEIYSNGNVVGTKFESYKVDFDQNRIDLWQNAATAVVRAGLLITEEGVTEQNIQYFDRYKLKVQLAARVDFKTIKNN